MSETKKAVSPKSTLAVLVIAALLYGGNLVREKWFGGAAEPQKTETNQKTSKPEKPDAKTAKSDQGASARAASAKKSAPVAQKRADETKKTANTSTANTSTAKTPTKRSRFDQDRSSTRKRSRFSQNRVGRGAPAVQWGGLDEVKRAFQAKRSDVFIEVTGVVVHILPLDTIGKRHQNFLVELANDITLKVSHNIDLAPMIPNLRKGMKLRIRGEYEYNDKGGVLHWTHHDPARRHPDGWIEVNGKKYG